MLRPSSGKWIVGSGRHQWGTLFLLSFAVATPLQWITTVRECSGEWKVGIEEWGVKGVEFRVGVSVRNRFKEKYCPLFTTSGQLFTSHSPLLGEKPLMNQAKTSPFGQQCVWIGYFGTIRRTFWRVWNFRRGWGGSLNGSDHSYEFWTASQSVLIISSELEWKNYGPTDRPTDTTSYRNEWTHLEISGFLYYLYFLC